MCLSLIIPLVRSTFVKNSVQNPAGTRAIVSNSCYSRSFPIIGSACITICSPPVQHTATTHTRSLRLSHPLFPFVHILDPALSVSTVRSFCLLACLTSRRRDRFHSSLSACMQHTREIRLCLLALLASCLLSFGRVVPSAFSAQALQGKASARAPRNRSINQTRPQDTTSALSISFLRCAMSCSQGLQDTCSALSAYFLWCVSSCSQGFQEILSDLSLYIVPW